MRRRLVAKRALDVVVSALLLLFLLPLLAAVALAVKLDSPGPVFFRVRRVGYRGSELLMLKFRKMREDAQGAPLTSAEDDRFTRVGRVLAATKLDELPQLWNVFTGEMTLVGARPEDETFVGMHESYERILEARPGMTGLSQLAFAKETQIMPDQDPVERYVERLLPAKIALDEFYVANRSLGLDLRILGWTAVAVLLRRDVAVNRGTAELSVRRRPSQPPRRLAFGRLGLDSVEEP
jgi:lipopolysaccharide/colanic/teichoic acid biosynthesis glycosyltransferase